MDNDKDASLGKQAEPIEDTARVRVKSIDDEASQHDAQPHPRPDHLPRMKIGFIHVQVAYWT